MRPFESPDLLTPNERLSEVANILATGILRLHTRAALPDTPKNLSNSTSPRLELPDETVLSVHNG